MREDHVSTIRDTTYADLPKIGAEENRQLLANFVQNLGIESATVRSTFIANNDSGLAQYLYGRPDGHQKDTRPTINLTQGTINTFVFQATRVPATINVISASVNEKGKWILIEPFEITEGNQTIPLQLFKEIPFEALDQVPEYRRICIDTETVVDFYQGIFDIHRRLSRMDQFIRDTLMQKELDGWAMWLFQWDQYKKQPVWHTFPALHWFPDPTEPDVKDMAYVRLDWVLDSEKSKRLYPKIKDEIDKFASRSLYFAQGSSGYSTVYLQTYQRPVVTLTLCFIRNQPAPMTLAEAIGTGLVLEVDGEDGDRDKKTPSKRHMLAKTDTDPEQDITGTFDDDGNPAKEMHNNHPQKLVNRQVIQIYETVASDTVCPHWDFPVGLDKNVPIPGRPFGQSETERIRTLQRDVNENHMTMVNHVQSYKGSAMVIDKSALVTVPESMLREGFSPKSIHVIESDGRPDFDIRKSFYPVDPPKLPEAITDVNRTIRDAYEDVAGHPSVDQGTPPPGVSSGKAILALQSQSQSSAGLKSQYSEESIYRMGMNAIHAIINFMEAEDLYRLSRKIPLQVLKEFVVPYARNMIPDIEVELNTGSAQVRAENDAKIRADAASKIVDPETARDKLRYDAEEIARREKQQRKEIMDEQAAAQAKAAPQQQPAPKEAIVINYKDAPPDIQRQMEQGAGFQPSTIGASVDQQHTAAKIQNEATRTQSDAAKTVLDHSHRTAQFAHTVAQSQQQPQDSEQPQPAGV